LRHISNYRLDPVDPGIRASELDVLDLSITKQFAIGSSSTSRSTI
jgi:hypothetical protein